MNTDTNTKRERDERLNTADLATRAPQQDDAPARQEGDLARNEQQRNSVVRPDDRGAHVAAPEERVEPASAGYRPPDAAVTPTPGAPAHQGAAHTPPAAPAAMEQTSSTGPGHPGSAPQTPPATGPNATPLLESKVAQEFRSRWESAQAGFVDDPRRAVEEADHLVAEAIQQLARTFADERAQLERAWSKHPDADPADVSTENMRLTLQRYRAFFHRLLSI